MLCTNMKIPTVVEYYCLTFSDYLAAPIFVVGNLFPGTELARIITKRIRLPLVFWAERFNDKLREEIGWRY